jgi:bifunctional enzyme CysN/CysC
VVRRSPNMPWYDGPVLLDFLETIDVEGERPTVPLRMQVQWVCRPNSDFRGFAGTIVSGRLRRNDPIMVAESGIRTTVSRILIGEQDCEEAGAGTAAMVTLEDEVDVSIGDVLCAPSERPEVVDQFAARLLWLAEEPLLPGRSYLLKVGARTVPASVTSLKYRLDIQNGAHAAAKTLAINEAGFCNFALGSAVAIDPFEKNRHTGGFFVIDRFTNATVGAGMVAFGLRRALNIHPHLVDSTKHIRVALKGHRPAALWFTGLSGAGKSTIAEIVERKLNERGCHTFLIDGDTTRAGLSRDLGFTEVDRIENVRRISEVTRLFVDAGLIAVVSLISPFRSERIAAREKLAAGEFIEIFVDTPIAVCRARDPKGLYAKVDRGELFNFTGIDSPYEPPDNPELRLETVNRDAESLADQVIDHLIKARIVD